MIILERGDEVVDQGIYNGQECNGKECSEEEEDRMIDTQHEHKGIGLCI